MPNGLRKPIWCLIFLAGCAGELEQSDRFKFLFGADGGPVGNGGTGGAVAAEPPACVIEFFEDGCGLSVCHGKGASMDLVSPGIAGRLVDKPSAEDLECAGRTLVSSTGGESLLLTKLTNVDCGMQMPFGGKATAEQIDCVRGWIDGMAAGGGGQDGGQ